MWEGGGRGGTNFAVGLTERPWAAPWSAQAGNWMGKAKKTLSMMILKRDGEALANLLVGGKPATVRFQRSTADLVRTYSSHCA